MGDGTSGSKQTIIIEFSANGVRTNSPIPTARSNDYDSASAQFFIVQKDSIYLDENYAVF